jgi:O-antigen/teichoic acid export membrane protein
VAPSKALAREAFNNHWSYGRWAIATNIVNWVPYNIYFLLLPIWGGLEATGALKALWNLLLPAMHMNAALTALLVPTLVKVRGRKEFWQHMRLFLIFFVFGSTAFWIFLGLFHGPIISWLYGGQYSEYSSLLWVLGFLPILMGSTGVLTGALRAHERPDKIFWAFAVSAALTLPLGILLMVTQGINGAAFGLLISLLTALGVTAWVCLRLLRSR